MGVRKHHVLGPLAVVITLGALGVIMWLGGEHVPRLDSWIEGFGAWGPIVYLAACVAAAVALMPGSLTKLAAGALFGLAEGMLWGFAGAALGSLAAFGVARLGRRSWLEAWLARKFPRTARFDRSVAEHGGRIVFLLRLSPLVPYSIINYALGLSRVRFRDYLIAAPGMIPSVLLYVYTGDVAREVADAAARGGVAKPWWEWVIVGMGLLATIWVTAILTKKAKAALREELAEAAASS